MQFSGLLVEPRMSWQVSIPCSKGLLMQSDEGTPSHLMTQAVSIPCSKGLLMQSSGEHVLVVYNLFAFQSPVQRVCSCNFRRGRENSPEDGRFQSPVQRVCSCNKMVMLTTMASGTPMFQSPVQRVCSCNRQILSILAKKQEGFNPLFKGSAHAMRAETM